MANQKNTTDYYVYLHRYARGPKRGQVFYVGKGCGNRANRSSGRSSFWKRIVSKHGFIVEFYATGLQEWYAHELEKDLIAYYGRENLCNFTDGGEGSSGLNHSENTKKILSEIAKNRDDYYRGKLSKARIGKKASLSTKNKLSKSKTGIKRSIDSVEKTANFHRGRKRSEETILKLRKIKSNIEHTNARKIICIDEEITFDSAKSAAIWLRSIGKEKAVGCGITRCLKLIVNKAYGFHWKYA